MIAEDYPVDFTLLANTDPEKGDVVEEVHIETVSGAKAFTLPAGYLSDTFEVELRGDATDGLAAALCHFYQTNNPVSDKDYNSWKDFINKNPKRIRKQ